MSTTQAKHLKDLIMEMQKAAVAMDGSHAKTHAWVMASTAVDDYIVSLTSE